MCIIQYRKSLWFWTKAYSSHVSKLQHYILYMHTLIDSPSDLLLLCLVLCVDVGQGVPKAPFLFNWNNHKYPYHLHINVMLNMITKERYFSHTGMVECWNKLSTLIYFPTWWFCMYRIIAEILWFCVLQINISSLVQCKRPYHCQKAVTFVLKIFKCFKI